MRSTDNAQLAVSGTKLNQQLLETFVRLVQAGNYHIAACKAVGISYQTYRRWMRQGMESTDDTDIHRQFFLRVNESDAYAEVNAVNAWRGHFSRDYRASRDFLARRFPERWGERQKILLAVDNELQNILAVLESKLPSDIYGQVIAALMASKDEVREMGEDGGDELEDPFLDFEQMIRDVEAE